MSWSSPGIIATGDIDLDKPHIAVSWHPSTLGFIYIGYRDSNGNLVVRKSTDGGSTLGPVRTISSVNPGFINGLQLVVSPDTGYVYAFWTDFHDDRIKWARSTDQGDTWTAAAVFPNVGTPARNLMFGELNSVVRAPSLLIARFNWAADRISVVWHECSSAPVSGNRDCNVVGQHTDVYYAALTPSGDTPKTRINDATVRDQFFPALDFDTSGNLIVTFYDRRDDPLNVSYRLYRAYIDPDGNHLPPTQNQAVSPFFSTPQSNWSFPNFIGDYHESWSTVLNGVTIWFSSWTGTSNNYADIFISTIQP